MEKNMITPENVADARLKHQAEKYSQLIDKKLIEYTDSYPFTFEFRSDVDPNTVQYLCDVYSRCGWSAKIKPCEDDSGRDYSAIEMSPAHKVLYIDSRTPSWMSIKELAVHLGLAKPVEEAMSEPPNYDKIIDMALDSAEGKMALFKGSLEMMNIHADYNNMARRVLAYVDYNRMDGNAPFGLEQLDKWKEEYDLLDLWEYPLINNIHTDFKIGSDVKKLNQNLKTESSKIEDYFLFYCLDRALECTDPEYIYGTYAETTERAIQDAFGLLLAKGTTPAKIIMSGEVYARAFSPYVKGFNKADSKTQLLLNCQGDYDFTDVHIVKDENLIHKNSIYVLSMAPDLGMFFDLGYSYHCFGAGDIHYKPQFYIGLKRSVAVVRIDVKY